MPDPLRQALLDWYGLLSSLAAAATFVIAGLDQRLGVPFVSPLLLGAIGATAPCQLTASVGALAILGGSRADRSRPTAVAAYLGGKALVYTALGALALALGAGLTEISIPVFVLVRKALGPLMVLVGLGMVGVLRWPSLLGLGIAGRLREAAQRGVAGAPFLLGVAFGFSFCPTLFGLFFGLLIPLALTRPDGLLYPALFAVGTALPLLVVLGLATLGNGRMRRIGAGIGRGQRVVALVAGVLLIVAGLHDALVYWAL